MLGHLILEVRATLLNPRAYAREVMFPRNYGPRELVTIGALAATLYSILAVVLIQMVANVDNPDIQALGLNEISSAQLAFGMFSNIAISLALTWVGAWKVGEMAGGTGGPTQVAAAVVWHSLCIILAIPVFVVVGVAGAVLAMITGLNLLIVVAVIGIFLFSLWIEASLVGEAHGFPNTRLVAICLLGGHGVVALISNVVLG